ncbi:hypothetical protein GCM10023226_29730 [Nocardioides nanhaiensis]|uniref:DUF1707 domain-containing protein n=2 Tax=Nocardioides nanhaiensis TaxID=1476871 RepID=A0ABP8WIF8_9ACTN
MPNRGTRHSQSPLQGPRMTPDPWVAFPHDPRDPAHSGLRASDAERELVRQMLTTGFAEGRLDREEYEERSDAVDTARTLGDLPPIVADLVPLRPAPVRRTGELVGLDPTDLDRRAQETWRAERRSAVLSLLGASLICWSIWVATGFSGPGFDPSFAWPAIVSAALLVRVLQVAATREERVAQERARLEKRQAKQLRARSWKRD